MVAVLIVCFNFGIAQDSAAVSDQLIKIHTKACILEFFENDTLVFAFPIRVGKMDTPTPLGTAYIYVKRNPPVFYKIDTDSGERRILYETECGDGIKKINYKNMRAIGLRYEKAIIDPKIAQKLNLGAHPVRWSIYSTVCSETIGLAVSNGSIGMTIPDMLKLFPRVKTGTPVVISDDSYWQCHEYKKMYKKLFADLEKQGYKREELENIFSDTRVRFYASLCKKPEEDEDKKEDKEDKKQRSTYLDWHLAEKEVQKGKDFLAEYDSLLSSAEQIYKVDKEVIVAILKIETNFGAYLGKYYNVFNVYNTLFLRHWDDEKKEWARDQLIAFLLICKKQELNPFEIYGSYAGAFGIPQFIPISYLSFAVDGNGDGKIDLFNMEDAVHSTANYLNKHGWKQEDWGLIHTIVAIIDKIKSVLYKYNPSSYYVDIVYSYAEAIKTR